VVVGAGAAGGEHTVHLVTADRERNMVSLTATHGSLFGSMVALEGLGLVLGHGMSRFDPVPGRPNSIAPAKRMQHNMSPLIIARNGRPYCAIGLPGGTKIINVSALLAHSLTRFGLACADAIQLPRFHVDGALETAVVDSEQLASAMQRAGCKVALSSDRLGGPVAGVMFASETDHFLAASENGAECVAVP
jgi:gamma-glutamyltranspeptidase/glutathione hydrolase